MKYYKLPIDEFILKGGFVLAIMRLWHGRVSIEKADDYEKFMIERAAPDYGSIDGLLKTYFQRNDKEKESHFLLVTIWDSLETVKKFAGTEHELAKYYPEDDKFLLEKEKFVDMYEIFYEN